MLGGSIDPCDPVGSGACVDEGDGGLTISVPMTMGQVNIVSVASAHRIEVTSTAGFVFWQQLDYDHDCLRFVLRQ